IHLRSFFLSFETLINRIYLLRLLKVGLKGKEKEKEEDGRRI
ncbi:hypothetical protein CMV_028115, partial [Castanea mollissima]